MSESQDPLLSRDTAPNEVSIDYIKAHDFRTGWADGAIGSPTPAGHIHVAFYAERPAIPRRQVHRVDIGKNELGPAVEEKTIGRNSIVREMSIDLVFTVETAKRLAVFLTEQTELLEKMRHQS